MHETTLGAARLLLPEPQLIAPSSEAELYRPTLERLSESLSQDRASAIRAPTARIAVELAAAAAAQLERPVHLLAASPPPAKASALLTSTPEGLLLADTIAAAMTSGAVLILLGPSLEALPWSQLAPLCVGARTLAAPAARLTHERAPGFVPCLALSDADATTLPVGIASLFEPALDARLSAASLAGALGRRLPEAASCVVEASARLFTAVGGGAKGPDESARLTRAWLAAWRARPDPAALLATARAELGPELPAAETQALLKAFESLDSDRMLAELKAELGEAPPRSAPSNEAEDHA